MANIYKSYKKYDEAINLYTLIMKNILPNSITYGDLLYRRGGSYERLGKYKESDEDLLSALKIIPENSYILNYLAYSWLERNINISEAVRMLEVAYNKDKNNPYIIDSIGWAYFLIKDYIKAEKFLIRAVQLMPDDPIVNDHYGDVLWKLNRKIQARYFWSNVLLMDEVEKEIIEKINFKISNGLKDS